MAANPPDAGADQVYEPIAKPPATVNVTVCGPHVVVGFTVAVKLG